MNRRNFLKVCAAGALGLLLSKVAPKRQEVVVGVDWARGEDETIVVDWRANQDGSDSYYWVPLKASINEPENILDMWVDGDSVYIYDSEGEYYVSPQYFEKQEVIWWFCLNIGEARLKHLENLRGRLALFQTLWSRHIERTEEVGREIEHLARIMRQVIQEI